MRWSAIRPATTRPAGVDTGLGFPRSWPSAPETQELSTCSARSAARTNDVDCDEHRRTLDRMRKPPLNPREANTTLELSPSQLRLIVPAWKERRRAGSDAVSAMADPPRVTPTLAWHPALRLYSSPNDAR